MAQDAASSSAQQIQTAVSGMKHAEKQSDSALQRALKDDAATNAELTSLAKGNDHLMAKIHQISSRLADPHERSERVRQRKEARMRQRIERQSLKQQQLIAFWTRKFANHITSRHMDDEAVRREDDTLKAIESNVIKLALTLTACLGIEAYSVSTVQTTKSSNF